MAVRRLPGLQRVYNLSVEGEHAYRVARCGLLVHNNGCGPGNVELCRAVMPEELADIQRTGRFINRGYAEGKYFTSSAQHASMYAKGAVGASGHPPYTIVKTSVAKTKVPVDVDGGIPAYVLSHESLEGLIPEILDSMPIPLCGISLMVPDALIKVRFLTTDEGGRRTAIHTTQYGCPIIINGKAFDCRFILKGLKRLEPGKAYELAVRFMDPMSALKDVSEGTPIVLWEGRRIAEGHMLRVLRNPS